MLPRLLTRSGVGTRAWRERIAAGGVDRVHDAGRRAADRGSSRREWAAGSPAPRWAGPWLRLPARSRRRACGGERRRVVPAARAGAVGGGRAVHGGGGCRGCPARPRRARLGEGIRRRPFVGRAPRPPRRGGDAGAAPRRARGRPARLGRRRTLAGVRRGDVPPDAGGRARAGARARRAVDGRQGRRRAGARGDAPRLARVLRRSRAAHRRCPSCEWRARARPRWCRRSWRSCRRSRRGCRGSASPSASSTAHGARCRSPPRRTRPSGFQARGSRWSRAPGISCGSRRPALFARRFDASPPTSGAIAAAPARRATARRLCPPGARLMPCGRKVTDQAPSGLDTRRCLTPLSRSSRGRPAVTVLERDLIICYRLVTWA